MSKHHGQNTKKTTVKCRFLTVTESRKANHKRSLALGRPPTDGQPTHPTHARATSHQSHTTTHTTYHSPPTTHHAPHTTTSQTESHDHGVTEGRQPTVNPHTTSHEPHETTPHQVTPRQDSPRQKQARPHQARPLGQGHFQFKKNVADVRASSVAALLIQSIKGEGWSWMCKQMLK